MHGATLPIGWSTVLYNNTYYYGIEHSDCVVRAVVYQYCIDRIIQAVQEFPICTVLSHVDSSTAIDSSSIVHVARWSETCQYKL